MERIEWLKWRKAGIGSSDAPVIMGVSPWSTPLKLYEEKISEEVVEDESNAWIKQKGNEFETRIRNLFELRTGEDFSPALCVMDGFEYLRASLDGRSSDKRRGIEIKLSGRDDWELAKNQGIVPAKYLPQVQHQNMVGQLEVTYFLSYLYEKGVKSVSADRLVVVEVAPDKEYISRLVSEEMKFWDCVVKRKPPVSSDRDYKKLRGRELLDKIDTWKLYKKEADKIEGILDGLRADIIAEADKGGHPRYEGAGVRIRKESRQGNVQYAKVPELKGIDLDPYRGKGSVSWKFEVTDES